MGEQYKPVGKAVAISKGHYPLPDGRHRTVQPGEVFTIFEGLETAKWFTQEPVKDLPAPVPEEPQTLLAAAATERKRKAAVNQPTSGD